jgi:hypothetical protein
MKRLLLTAAAFAFLLGASCERHSWEDVDANKDGKIDQNEKGTKGLYEKHEAEGGSKEKH